MLASQELSDDDEDKRPSVQVGDPFTGKKLIEASLALVEGGLVQSLQDLGAAGLASSLSEMARGGVGLDVHLDRVPLREADMEPVEIVISESQERMVCVTDQPDAVAKVCARWELEVADIGVVTASGALRMFWDDEVVGEIPAELLTEETPRYRVATRPRTLQAPISDRPIKPETAELLDLLRTPGLKSRVSVYRRYDHLVGSRTVRRPGLDAAVLRLRPSHRGLAVSLDGSGRIASLDPQTGGMLAVLEAARNVACAGGKPLALTDCLNFGNPEKPEIAWELTEAIEGMSLACEALGIPVVSGNVSLYNETDGTAIHPTPVVGLRRARPRRPARPGRVAGGRCDLRRRRARARARRLGVPGALPRRPGRKASRVRTSAPRPRSSASSGARLRRLTASHDVSEGGLAVALAELALWSGLGARVELEEDAVAWFGEGGGQAVVACRPEDESVLEGMPYRRDRRGGRLEDLRRRARRPRPRRRLRLMCGIFGIHAPDRDVARLTYFGLFALQHRGQESAGIAVSDEGRVTALRDMGLVTQVFSEQKLRGLTGQVAVGHARYSTTGSTHWANAQPIIQQGRARTVALGHNGNLTNTSELRAGLLAEGARLRSTSDTEVIAALIARDERPLEEAVAGAMGRIEGAFSAVLVAEGKLVGFRDPLGIRPLVLGRLEDDWLLASETCALDLLGAEVERELAPGRDGDRGRERVRGAPGGRARRRGLPLHLRVHLLRPARLEAPRRRAARRPRAHGRAAGRRGAGRGRPRHGRAGLGHAGCDRLRARERDPLRRGPDQEPLRRAHVHPARPGAPRARDQDEVQPARRGLGEARRGRGRLDRPRYDDPKDRGDALRGGRARGAPAHLLPADRLARASTGSTWPTRTS